MLADAETDIAPGAVLDVKILVCVDVIGRRAVEIGGAADEEGQGFGEGLEDFAAGFAGGDFRVLGELGHAGEKIGGDGFIEAGVEEGGFIGIGRAPCLVHLVPGIVMLDELLLAGGEKGACLRGDVEVLICREAEFLDAVRVHEFRAGLAVGLLGAGDLGDAFADEGVGDDELGLAGGGFGFLECGEEGLHVVAVIESLDVPAVGVKALAGVLALGGLGHGVEGDVVGIVNQDEVIELVMGGELRGLV